MRYVALLAAVIAILASVAYASEVLDVFFFNVGAGDAILIKLGDTEWLIDTGYKNKWGSAQDCSGLLGVPVNLPVEYFVLSHPDLDHYSALDLFLCPCHVQTVSSSMDPRAISRIDTELELRESTACGGAKIGRLHLYPGSTAFPADNGLSWEVLHPDIMSISGNLNVNDTSLVLLLTYGDIQFLFPGDLEALPKNVGSWPINSGVLILKAPHHGKQNSATIQLAERFRPVLVIVSTGDDVPETAVELAQMGIPLLSTNNSGTIHISTDGQSVWVTTASLSSHATVIHGE